MEPLLAKLGTAALTGAAVAFVVWLLILVGALRHTHPPTGRRIMALALCVLAVVLTVGAAGSAITVICLRCIRNAIVNGEVTTDFQNLVVYAKTWVLVLGTVGVSLLFSMAAVTALVIALKWLKYKQGWRSN